MAKLRVAFADIMEERTIDVIDRLSCTLLFVAVKDRRMMIGHIGDGLIVRVSPSGVSPISMPQNDKDGKTYFVTAAHADNYMRLLKTTVDDVHAIALMTDGVQDSVYNEDAGLVKPVVAKMAETFADGREEALELCFLRGPKHPIRLRLRVKQLSLLHLQRRSKIYPRPSSLRSLRRMRSSRSVPVRNLP